MPARTRFAPLRPLAMPDISLALDRFGVVKHLFESRGDGRQARGFQRIAV